MRACFTSLLYNSCMLPQMSEQIRHLAAPESQILTPSGSSDRLQRWPETDHPHPCIEIRILT